MIGPGDVVHTIQSKYMAVDIPRHINDDDLAESNPTEQPLSQPTTMSYVLQRRKLAEIALCMSETVPSDPHKATYDLIISLDSKLEHLLEELPIFFRLETHPSEEARLIDEKHIYIPIQRHVITMMINLVRCQLHFPYLVGSSNTALHIFSREICLRAARSVLAAHQGLAASKLSHMSDFMKAQGTVLHMFMGGVILATDLCCNQPRGIEREQQLSELMRVCTVLDSIKHHSQIAAKFLESLTGLLVRYGVWSSSMTIPPTIESTSMPNEAGDPYQQWQLGDYPFDDGHMEQQNFDMPLVFDDLWETFVERPSVFDMVDFV